MSASLALTAEDRAALKTAFRLLVAHIGGLEAAASVTRVGTAHLARYYDLGDAVTFPPADVVADLERVAGSPFVTAEQARIAGYRLIPVVRHDGSHLAAAVAEATRHSGDIPAVLIDALADGVVSPSEAANIGRNTAAQIARLEEVQAEAQALAGTGSPAAPAVKGEGAPAACCPSGSGGGRRRRRRR